MTNKIRNENRPGQRNRERGAALLTMLLVSILLLSAGLALVTSTSLSATHAIDSTAEMQAYAAAEGGLEATLNVLRGHVAPNALLGATRMNFRTAANPATSNSTTDLWATGASATSRLSGWLNYSYQNAADVNDWRVPITAAYAPNTGIAFKILVFDPDDSGPIATRRITTDPNYRPTRLLIRSEGFGPKGAIKRLEMIVKYSAFDFTPPAAVNLPGGPGLALDLGDSSNVSYSGNDLAVPPQSSIAAIAVSAGNEAAAQGHIDELNDDSQVTPNNPATLDASNTPSFVQSATAARLFLAEQRELAALSGRLFSSKAEADASPGGMGTSIIPKLTFIDNYGGDPVELGPNHQGSGLLIVTGELDTNGNTDFEGVILVLGRGSLDRDGGGAGVLRGAIVVANFDPDGTEVAIGPPDFSINGGGDSKIAFDSLWVRKALDVSGLRVLGVREYH
ncbi:MAG: hypothetical protein AABN95_00465 [Acidobacteriota bacterium]